MNTIFVLFSLFVAGFFIHEYYKTYKINPEQLSDNEIEDIFIKLKKNILAANHAKQEELYNRINDRLHELIGQILSRHQHFVLDVEAKYGYTYIRFNNYNLLNEIKPRPLDFQSGSYFVVSSNIDLKNVEEDILLYLCFFLYVGGVMKNIGPIMPDTVLMNKILDFLIKDRNFYPAIFLKGLVMKYGVTVDGPSFSKEAKTLLELANHNGIGSAAIELNNIHKYLQLDDMRTVNNYS
ncbi:hypothetical protein [Methylomonas koyamae]|uniref:hypothetical protein n=1 Tax=Methylomonas koyamae TaxID=702114 RepID=UPI000BC31A42|nr:hypothetical protein [Methylomonas koyamae]ATG92565.1 hypothetical protein MKLM6_4407 [Methylomonas koyamae]